MNLYLQKQNSADCCGCSACVQACPTACLHMRKTEEGFLYPSADFEKCINCGLCEKVCPLEHFPLQTDKQQCFAAIHNSSETLRASSSGGVFYALAENILAQGGAVFGAALDDDRVLRHTFVNDIADLPKLMGSKYIQSEMQDSFAQVRDLLQKGTVVLFVGTPCQVAGLRLYLQKAYENLYTVDLLCHGVPSDKMFQAYVDFLEKKHGGRLTDIRFRDKEKNGWSITLRYDIEKNGKTKRHYVPAGLSPYFFAFLRGKILRESCYRCPYTKTARPGDLTLADFWGVEKVLPDLQTSQGCSAVIANTEKGKRLFGAVQSAFAAVPATMEQVTVQNINFFEPCKRPEIRDTVYAQLDEYGFHKLADMYFKNPRRMRMRIKQIFKF
ncbi:MAG: Coenzyme F420 hydrogenase/dehydrogenase, beta subunit C-terminal domain [Candidatus Fimenecus sp.]